MPLSTIKTASLADNAVSTAKIADTAVSTAKMANEALNGRRNLVINGAMEVDQRNATTTLGAITYGLDRFTAYKSHDGTQTMVQSTEAPTGFKNSLKVTTTTADSSLAAGQRSSIIYRFEGQDTAHLEFGTSDAKTITLSFYVRSSITGTHGGNVGNGSDNRGYPFTYTISSADTWERKTITIPGDTSGTWVTTTARGLQICWGLGVGTTYSGTAGAWASADYNSATGATTGVTNTLNATWYLTGVQLEVGSTATPFEHRPYADELQRCKRYFEKMYLNSYSCQLSAENSQQAKGGVIRFVEKRASPSITFPTIGTGSNQLAYTEKSGSYVTQGSTFRSTQTKNQMSIFNNYADGFSGMDAGENIMLYVNGSVAIDVKSEL